MPNLPSCIEVSCCEGMTGFPAKAQTLAYTGGIRSFDPHAPMKVLKMPSVNCFRVTKF